MNESLGLGAASPVAAPHVGALGASAAVALAAVFGLLHLRQLGSPGGEPSAVARVEIASLAPAPALPAPPHAAPSALPSPPPGASADQIEAASGVKVIRAGGAPPSGVFIDVQRALAVKLEPAPDARLAELSRYGLLPRIGADGARPFDVYARPIALDTKLPASAPRIALMVGGLGLNLEGSESAIAKLPGAVTLGFAPYGAAIEARAAKARAAGHEIALEAPMEDFADPAWDSAPHMLKASASEVENIDSLRWLMARFTGYVAIVSPLGGGFTADRHWIAPVLREIAERGLGFLDDSSSPRSMAPDAAATLAAMPSARADVVIDADPAPQAVDAALARLIELARERGSAIGVATAAPASIERLARWAAVLDAKGVALVPLSSLMSGAPRAPAQARR